MTDRQTDRQPNTKARGSWWAVTGYHEDIPKLQGIEPYPEWVKKVEGQLEVCPTTGTLHFQGRFNTVRQVRWTQIQKWIPKSHFDPVRNMFACGNYITKDRTAVPDSYINNSNDTSQAPPVYLLPHQVMFKLAEAAYSTYYREGFTFTDLHDTVKGIPTNDELMNLPEEEQIDIQIDKTYSYTKLFQKLVISDPALARYCNSSSRTQWMALAPSFLRMVYDDKKKGLSCDTPSITHEEPQTSQDADNAEEIEDLEDLIKN